MMTSPSTVEPRSPHQRLASIVAACGVAMLASAANADTVVLTSVTDNTLIEDATGAYSCGAAQYFFAGRVGVNGGSSIRRGAVRFDLSSIPAGSTITGVSLRLYCSAAGLTSAQTVSLKRFQASWGEGPSVAFGGGGAPSQSNDVTWLHRHYPNSLWTTPGGQFVPTVTASRSVGTVGYYTWSSTPQFITDVQQMVNQPATNFGWMVQGNETTLQAVKRFDSHESTVAASRPQLTVVYLPPTSYDLTGDNKVNGADLAALLGGWGIDGPADFNNDGTVGAPDLAILLGAWTS